MMIQSRSELLGASLEIHVDDDIAGGTQRCHDGPIKKLTEKYAFTWKNDNFKLGSEECKPLTYTGIDIKRRANGFVTLT